VNTRDRQAGAVTAAQQKNDITDRQATPQIRRSLKDLSTYAHNIRVIARRDKVTLKVRRDPSCRK
jgi:hypothetical protein